MEACACGACKASWFRAGWKCKGSTKDPGSEPRLKIAARPSGDSTWSIPTERALQRDPFAVLEGMGSKKMLPGQRMAETASLAMAKAEAEAMHRMS